MKLSRITLLMKIARETYVGHVAMTSGEGSSGTEKVSHLESWGKETISLPP